MAWGTQLWLPPSCYAVAMVVPTCAPCGRSTSRRNTVVRGKNNRSQPPGIPGIPVPDFCPPGESGGRRWPSPGPGQRALSSQGAFWILALSAAVSATVARARPKSAAPSSSWALYTFPADVARRADLSLANNTARRRRVVVGCFSCYPHRTGGMTSIFPHDGHRPGPRESCSSGPLSAEAGRCSTEQWVVLLAPDHMPGSRSSRSPSPIDVGTAVGWVDVRRGRALA
jgi:hypothetical protein